MRYLLFVHLTGADRTEQGACAASPERKSNDDTSAGGRRSDRLEPFFGQRVFDIGRYAHSAIEHTLNFRKRKSVFLAFLPVAAVPIKTRKLHRPPLPPKYRHMYRQTSIACDRCGRPTFRQPLVADDRLQALGDLCR